jgi:proton translocating ATP synthase F1 alpha subunit
MGEIVVFHTVIGAVKGITLTLNGNFARIAIFGNESSISQGTEVAQNKEVARVPIGVNVLGRIIDPLGNPLDQKGTIQTQRFIKSDRKAKGIIYRKSINEPFLTGIIAIDTMIPIGRGQRELIIGDRQLGKTSIALDSIINQNRISDTTKMFCVYVAIGQKKTTILQISRVLEETRASSYTVIVSATADESAALQYLAPYAGTAIAEYFRDNGRHSLVVLDDLSKHAIAYRQMSLLVRRPPGRDAYPGDVFYLHSRLLERGSKLSNTFGGGSLTVLPIIETMENDVSAYIPTNVISITDGQIYIDKKVARQGILPAVNVGLSVSRIGSAAQLKNIKITSGALKLQLTKYREVEHFLTFASEIDDETLTLIYRGIRILEILKQKRFKPLSIAQQLSQLYAVLSGAMDRLPVEFMQIMKTYINSIGTRIGYNNVIGKGYEVYLSSIAKSIRNIATYNTIKAKLRRIEYKQNVQA